MVVACRTTRHTRERLIPGIRANINGTRAEFKDDDHRGMYIHYLKSVVPVAAIEYEQGPLGICHLYGNLTELTCSSMVEAAGNKIRINHLERVTLGRSWDVQKRGTGIEAHAAGHMTSSYFSFAIGCRLAY